MNRKNFLKTLALLPFAGIAMKLNQLYPITHSLPTTKTMPVLFLGHGSPMNAIEENEFVTGFRNIAAQIPRPSAVLCISAHWETQGTYVTAMDMPPTIHDFGGFPKALFEVQYPAPGNPALAKDVQTLVQQTQVGLDYNWGLDHGAWSVVKHLFPNADVPVIQMSLDYRKNPAYHYQLAKELATLRQKGVLIIGSGNMVHNLGLIDWSKLNTNDYGFEWALEAKTKMTNFILNQNHQPLINYAANGKAFQLAIPTPEHYLPLLYALALQQPHETATLFNNKAVAGSLTMTSVKIG